MEPVNNYDFQVLNCPANAGNICMKDKKKRYCYDCKSFCVIKQQIVYNWVMQNLFKASTYPLNIGFKDLPANNISLLEPCEQRIAAQHQFDNARINRELEFERTRNE